MEARSAEPETVLRGHSGEITAAAFAWKNAAGLPTLLSGASNGEVRLWSLQTFRPLATLDAHKGSSCLAVRTLANSRILTQGRDGAVRIWDASEGIRSAPLLELPSECYNFCQCACSESLVGFSSALTDETYYGGSRNGGGDDVPCDASSAAPATATNLGEPPRGPAAPLMAMPDADAQQLQLWDLRQRSAARTLAPLESHGKAGMCMCARFAASDAMLLSGWEDGSLHSFDLRGGAGAATARKLHSEPLLCLDVDGTGAHVLTGSADCKLVVTPLLAGGEPGEPVGQLQVPVTNKASGSGGLASICNRPDGKIFAAGGWDRRVRIWQWKRFKPLAVLQHHTGTVNTVCFSPCSHWLASASSDSTIALWKLFPPKGESSRGRASES